MDAANVLRLEAEHLGEIGAQGNTPWLWVQTVSFWPSHCATAHDGPIEPWHWNGRV